MCVVPRICFIPSLGFIYLVEIDLSTVFIKCTRSFLLKTSLGVPFVTVIDGLSGWRPDRHFTLVSLTVVSEFGHRV